MIAMFNFKELIELWRSDNLLTQALNDSHTMLENTRVMLRESIHSLRESDNGEIKTNVYDMDIDINIYEREVRKKVLKHLAITGGTNIIPGLILTSIVIDLERLGDYTKNIMDLAVAHPKRLECGQFEEEIQKIETSVKDLFDQVIPAVKETNKALAQELIKGYWWILKLCDDILDRLMRETDKTLGSGDAVTIALYSRYLKRCAAHLINVSTSIVNPFEAISFYRDDE